jgi:uncharacterized protein
MISSAQNPNMADSASWLPLLPLHTVLFPHGVLPLKIFETRYIDMVGACMKRNTPFGVVLIKSGRETGTVAEPEAVGCFAHIMQWDMPADGILTLRVEGGRRFKIEQLRSSGNLLEARVDVLPAESPQASDAYAACVAALRLVITDIERKGSAAEPASFCSPFAQPLRLDDAGWVANRWCEVLPLSLKARQKLLELEDAGSRLAIVDQYLRQHHIL